MIARAQATSVPWHTNSGCLALAISSALFFTAEASEADLPDNEGLASVPDLDEAEAKPLMLCSQPFAATSGALPRMRTLRSSHSRPQNGQETFSWASGCIFADLANRYFERVMAER